MAFWKNKHVVTAMIVTPILAIIAYFAVDYAVAEKPHVAQSGQAYPLVAQSNCRYTSGQCSLQNTSFESTLTYDREAGVLHLSTSHALQTAAIGFVSVSGLEQEPTSMTPLDSARTNWQMSVSTTIDESTLARVALRANDAYYYAETEMAFINYQTGFDKDFRKNN